MNVPLPANADALEDLARRSSAPVELVKDLYEDEVTKLKAGATCQANVAQAAT